MIILIVPFCAAENSEAEPRTSSTFNFLYPQVKKRDSALYLGFT